MIRRRQHPPRTQEHPEPPPRRPAEYGPRARTNAAGLVMETAERCNELCARRGVPIASQLWRNVMHLAGESLGHGGEVEDALRNVTALLDREAPMPPTLPEPARPAPIDPGDEQDTGSPEKPPSEGVSDHSLTDDDEEDLPL